MVHQRIRSKRRVTQRVVVTVSRVKKSLRAGLQIAAIHPSLRHHQVVPPMKTIKRRRKKVKRRKVHHLHRVAAVTLVALIQNKIKSNTQTFIFE